MKHTLGIKQPQQQLAIFAFILLRFFKTQ